MVQNLPRSVPRHVTGFLWFAIAIWTCPSSCGAEEPKAKPEIPDKYTLDYPVTDRWCPPVRSTFVEAMETVSQVRGKTFRHQPNGGYGLPVVDKVGDKNLLHLGADLGWYQIGEPVFAVANGVVRKSAGPIVNGKEEAAKPAQPKALMWGNYVVIEHQTKNDAGDIKYLTTIYGHLDHDRRVQAGDVVHAGQQIGTIGRKNPNINGGFNPHVHFGTRTGRAAEIDAVLTQVQVDGKWRSIRIVALDEERVTVKLTDGQQQSFRMNLAGEEFVLETKDDALETSARILWLAQFPDFPIVGYDLTTDGWRDPIQTLRSFQADTNPAPFKAVVRKKSVTTAPR